MTKMTVNLQHVVQTISYIVYLQSNSFNLIQFSAQSEAATIKHQISQEYLYRIKKKKRSPTMKKFH